jgi:hypothetical protein
MEGGRCRHPDLLPTIKREISEKKWPEARRWAEGRITGRKYKLPQRVEKIVAGSPKRLAARFYQLRTGHCLTGEYLKWTKNRASAECGWCPGKVQTREHLLKNCLRWKLQQKTLWAEVRRDTGRGKNRFKIRDLFADERCTRAILSFLRTTKVGRKMGDEEGGRKKKNGAGQKDRGEVHGRREGE